MIQEADVIVYDRLVGDHILDLARKEAKFINAGKKGFGVSMPQADISAHLLHEASQGQVVVRLKGGDPGMFGRLDEELTALTAGWGHNRDHSRCHRRRGRCRDTTGVSDPTRQKHPRHLFDGPRCERVCRARLAAVGRYGASTGRLYGSQDRGVFAGAVIDARCE